MQMQELHGNTEDSKEDPHGKWMLSSSSQLTPPYDCDLDEKSLFSKTTEAFVATCQINYGFPNDGVCSSTANVQVVRARDAEELLQRKTTNLLLPKRGEIKERWNQDDFMLRKTEIQMYHVCFAFRH